MSKLVEDLELVSDAEDIERWTRDPMGSPASAGMGSNLRKAKQGVIFWVRTGG